MGGGAAGWFVVLPDCDTGSAAAAAFYQDAQVVNHASGRPWLIGRWPADHLTLGTAGKVRIAVVGICSATSEDLSRVAGRTRSTSDLDEQARTWSGCFHLLASVDGRIRAQGTASGLRRVFHTRLGDAVVCGDRSDVLARAVGSDMAEDVLALRLMEPFVPHPFTERSVWRDVEAVPAGNWLEVRGAAESTQRRWWSPPAPELSLVEGAERVRSALSEAVALRTRGGGTISADLSGGLDSTPLCFLAAQGPASLIAFTRAGTAVDHDDADWARRAAEHLPGVTHEVVDPASQPSWWMDLAHTGERMDEPTLGARNWAQSRHTARALAERGARLHLSGEGGDQVLLATPGFLHDTVRSNPGVGFSYLRAASARARWSPLATVKAAAENRSYGQWLADTASMLDPNSLRSNPLGPNPLRSRKPEMGWQFPPALPPWCTPAALAAVREHLRAAAPHVEPLAPSRGQHGTVLSIRGSVAICRNLTRVTSEAGAPTHYPFYDDRVIEACLSVRMHERTSPFSYKPLMVAAMRGVVPDELLSRGTKGEFSAEMRGGLREQRAALAAITEDSLLARLGIVDARAFRESALGSYSAHTPMAQLESSLALEAWLRAQEDIVSAVEGSA